MGALPATSAFSAISSFLSESLWQCFVGLVERLYSASPLQPSSPTP